MANKFVQTYLREIEQILARGNATEHSYRGALQRLTDALNPKVRAVNEPKRVNVGAPDYIILEGERRLIHLFGVEDLGAHGQVEVLHCKTRDRQNYFDSYVRENFSELAHHPKQEIFDSCLSANVSAL